MSNSQAYSEFTKGFGPVPPAQGVYEMSATQKAELGYRIAFNDGRVFRYAKAGATALAPGKFCKAGVINESNCLNKAVNAAVVVGTYAVTLQTGRAYTTCEEGYLQINDVAGEGIMYKIKSGAANATTATYTDLVLYDPVATALTGSSEGTIILNPYEQAEICSAVTDIILGVPPITVTAEYFFWVQTWGIANVLSEGITPAGQAVQLAVGDGVGGTTSGAAYTTLAVGIQMLVGVNTEYKPVYLMITP